MRLVASAAAMVAGVHGRALAWLPFLPWQERTVGVVEVTLATRRGVINDCYEKWSNALGERIRYFRVAGRLTGSCNGGASSRDNEAEQAQKILSCNVTVDTSQLLQVQPPQRLRCQLTAERWKTRPAPLLPVIAYGSRSVCRYTDGRVAGSCHVNCFD